MDTLLPLEILDKLLYKCQLEDLCRCRLVSRKWNDVAVLSLRKLHDTIKFSEEAQVDEFITIMKPRIQVLPYSTFTFCLPLATATGTTTTRPEILLKNFGIWCQNESFPNNLRIIENHEEGRRRKGQVIWGQPPRGDEDHGQGQSVINLIQNSPDVNLLKIDLPIGQFVIPPPNLHNLLEKMPIFEYLTKVKYSFEPRCYEVREFLLEGIVARAPFLRELILFYYHDECRSQFSPSPSSGPIRVDILKLPGLLRRLPTRINFGIIWGQIYLDERHFDLLRELGNLDPQRWPFFYFEIFPEYCDLQGSGEGGRRARSMLWDWIGKNRAFTFSLNVEWGFTTTTFDFPILPACLVLNLGYALSNDPRHIPNLYNSFPNLSRLKIYYDENRPDLKPLLSKLPKLENLELWGLPAFYEMFDDGDPEAELLPLLAEAPPPPDFEDSKNPFGKMPALKFLTVSHCLTRNERDEFLNPLRMLIISNRNWIHRLQRLYFHFRDKQPCNFTTKNEEYRKLLLAYHDEVIISQKKPRDAYGQLYYKKWRK